MPPPTRFAFALDVPPLSKRGHAHAHGTRINNYHNAEGAIALAQRARDAWLAIGQPAPLVEIAELRGVEFNAAAGGGKSVLRCPRVRALGGVPAGYAGRMRVL